MERETAEAYLTQRGIPFSEKQVPFGVQLRCATGEILAIFESGKVVVQGKPTTLRDELGAWVSTTDPGAVSGPAPPAPKVADGLNRSIFVVYGHDVQSREGLELLLMKMGMHPIVLGNLAPGGNTVIEALEQNLIDNPDVKFACVLLTPDDEGHPVGKPDENQYRARQNVILELGMVFGHLKRKRVAILYKESVELPSDIAGVLYIPYKERVDEQANMLFRVLDEAGYKPNKSAL